MRNKAIIAEVKTLSANISFRNYQFLKITAEDGTVGWAEFDVNFGSPGVAHIIDEFAHRLIGQSAMYHEFIYEDLRNMVRPGWGGVVSEALGAIENALLDLKAKSLDVPVYMLLGGKMRDKLRVYWSHCVSYRHGRGSHYPEDKRITDKNGVRKISREVVEQGFTALKTNIFHYDENDKIYNWGPGMGGSYEPGRNIEKPILRGMREHLEVIRETAGPDMDILIDLNFNMRTEGYLRTVRELADLDLFWIEIDTLDPQALAYIRSQSKHPISSCETLIGLNQFLPFFQQQAVDVAIIDTPWNGVWQSMKIAAAAAAYEVNVAPHNFYGHLATMMNAHFSAAVPNFRIMETDIDRIAWDHELFTHVPEYKDGYLIVPDRPGWGTEPNEAAFAKYPANPKLGPTKRSAPGFLTI
ncbi:MAG: mandelate racemase/muconate lactonizing enzyme family protein [Hyphomicrobiales bacterium]|nr:MAG: mandelate racemase/muconate lactonizing enzyme family protein [Hyphomicrobiales bacterium]